MRLLTALTYLLAIAGAGIPSAALAGTSPASWQLGIAFIDDLARQTPRIPIVVYSQVEVGERDWRRRRDWFYRNAKSRPPASLFEADARAASADVLAACPSLTAALRQRGIRYGETALAWATAGRPFQHYRARVIGLSLPVVSADGKHGLLEASSALNNDSGRAHVYHMRRTAPGKWRVAGKVLSTLS